MQEWLECDVTSMTNTMCSCEVKLTKLRHVKSTRPSDWASRGCLKHLWWLRSSSWETCSQDRHPLHLHCAGIRHQGDTAREYFSTCRGAHRCVHVLRCQTRTATLWPTRREWSMSDSQKGRVVLRGDIVKDDSGAYAVFTEQGSSAPQMTAAKIMDIISRLPGCDGQAADAVSAYTQVKMEDAHKLLKIPKSECPDIWIRLPRHKWPKSWSSMEDPVVPLERNLYGHPLAGLIWERQF